MADTDDARADASRMGRPDPAPGSRRARGRGPYAQPSPKRLYVHDDLTDEVRRRLGPDAPATALAGELLELLRRDRARVTVLGLAEQVERLSAHGPHAPFDRTLGIGRAGERVAGQIHARTGWFPRIERVDVAREEDGQGGYRLVSAGSGPLEAQLAGLEGCASLAVVDDTVFSGLTMREVLSALPPGVLSRTRAFCLRGVAETIASLATLCPVVAGVTAPGQLLDDVSFINASGLVLRIAIRRQGRPPLAFFDRPAWLRAWFPGYDREVLELCRRLNALLEPAPDGKASRTPRP